MPAAVDHATASSSMSSTDVAARGVAFDLGQLGVDDGERVVAARVEVGELVDPVEHVADELLEEQARGDADLAAELAGDGAGQQLDVGVVARRVRMRSASSAPSAYRSRTRRPTSTSASMVNPARRIWTARGLSNRASVVKSVCSRCASGGAAARPAARRRTPACR